MYLVYICPSSFRGTLVRYYCYGAASEMGQERNHDERQKKTMGMVRIKKRQYS